MKTSLIATLTVLSLAVPAVAQDVTKGEKEFNKCKACHMIQDADGTDIIKGGKTGPNLYGIVGRHFAAVEDYKYGDGILKLAEAYPDAVWDVHSLKAYVTDPTGYLDEYSGDPKAKSKMTFKLTKNQDDLVAFLESVSPDAPPQPEESEGEPMAPPAE
ncbi:c-type cytochrome [Paracoccus jeotgali]|uniref:c-type cytochrome n=1 Tax=Paracoccus jeotgali TaxID=2065379 RepID=UPI0028AB43C3|nr:cytochrome C [Paracoccus jeotgali]